MSSKWKDAIAQGVTAGLLGFATVALFFALENLFAGRSPFYTAALLGATVFHGATDPSQVSVTPENVLLYNGLHLVTFIAFGLIGSALATLADRGAQLWYVGLFFFIFVAFHLVGVAQGLAMPMRAAISDASVWIAGLAASTAMAAYILWQHPRIRAGESWAT